MLDIVKQVNSKAVHLVYADLFLRAAQGAVAPATVNNEIVPEKFDATEVSKIVTRYNEIQSKLVYPLSTLTVEPKVCMEALLLQKSGIKNRMWVDVVTWLDVGLCVALTPKVALRLVRDSWGFVQIDGRDKQTARIDAYKTKLGFKEFAWAQQQILNGQDTRDFYSVFCPELVQLAGSADVESAALKEQIKEALISTEVVANASLAPNTIVDMGSGVEYSIDMHYTTKRNKDKRNLLIRMTGSEVSCENQDSVEYTIMYDVLRKVPAQYTAYGEEVKQSKRITYSELRNPNNKEYAILNRQVQLIVEAATHKNPEAPLSYRGLLVGDLVACEVNGVFEVWNARTGMAGMVIHGGTLIGVTKKNIYVKTTKDCVVNNNTIKESRVYGIDAACNTMLRGVQYTR